MKISIKLISLLICICLTISPMISFADIDFQIGDYFQIGKYNDASVIWRLIDEDANGKLLLSDKILCFKAFSAGGNFWQNSTLRVWLNSTALAGEIVWSDDRPPKGTQNPYDQEKGFLQNSNFNQSERNLMKTVTQWTMLPTQFSHLATNGYSDPYNATKELVYYQGDISRRIYYDISELPSVYYGAAYQLEDTIFLLDEMQLYNMWKNLGDVEALRTEESWVDGLTADFLDINNQLYYWLRTPNNYSITAWTAKRYVGGSQANDWKHGVRPAFYLNELAVNDFTGSGTEDDPYILITDPNYISVELNNMPISFDVLPIIENDRVLVPMRAIFEKLGAEVQWDGETETITATTADTTVVLTINQPEMYVNGEKILLDTPATIVNSRTLVPIRAVSESLGTTVEWKEDTKQVIITTND